MKKSKIPFANALSAAMVMLSWSAALAQTPTNAIPGTYVISPILADTNQPGFIWNVSEVIIGEPDDLSWAEAQLAGLKGNNLADPTQISTAAGLATVQSNNPTAPISFYIPGVVNFSIVPGDTVHNRPDLPAEDQMPGIPGAGGTDNIAAEALAYLDLPAGPTTIGVRSDDGFRLTIGAANPADRYSTNGVVVSEYEGGRSASDSIATIVVPKAGLYAARLLYENGGGDASVEWYTFPGTNAAILTNAVLINDVADGGIPAYAAVLTNTASYVSSLDPSPGATGVSPVPAITAQIVNGAVPVSGITLSLNGAAMTPSITTTSNGATVSASVPSSSFLPANSVNTLVLDWVDNGIPESINWTFSASAYVLVSPAQAVTAPDTTKPGFLLNVFENAADVTPGDNEFFDNTELGLNGLLPSSNIPANGTASLEDGGLLTEPGLQNYAVAANLNGAVGPATTFSNAPSAPLQFQVAAAINLTNSISSFPGLPGADTTSGGHSFSELLTYVQLPVGLTEFNLTLDGYYRAFLGSWDYTLGQEAGSVNNAQQGSVQFYVYASAAGYYPLRLTYFNGDGTPTLALSAITPNGTNALVGDTAHGGLAAYRALTTTSEPYIRYTSPRPVAHQMNIPSPDIFIRLQDGALGVNDTTPSLILDGQAAALATNRLGNVLELTYTSTNLQIPSETHTAILTYKDTAGHSLSNQWSFMNWKATWLPASAVPTPGVWLPATGVAIETFDEYNLDPVYNDLFFTNSPAGTNWFVYNFDAPSGEATNNYMDPNSDAYANFVLVTPGTFAGIEGDSADVAGFEMLNGQPITQLSSGNFLIAESDNRANGNPGQVQFAISRSFNLTGVTNPVLAFASIYKQNQDNFGGVEYSVDGQQTWNPVIYYLDGGEFSDSGDPPDLMLNADGTVNVALSLANSHDPPHWTNSSGVVETTYGAGVAAPITQALSPFFAPRINDDKAEGKRLEVIRLPLAANKSDVRLRWCQLGTCSWYIGVDNIAFFDIPQSGASVPTGVGVSSGAGQISVTESAGKIVLSWTAGATVQLQQNSNLTTTNWVNVAGTLGAGGYTNTIAAGSVFYRLIAP